MTDTAGKIPIAMQLYSVRDDCAKDLPKVLSALAAMGYEGVEFAGFYDYSAADIKALLDSNGLRVAGSHTGIDALQGDALDETVAFNKAIGNRYLIVPWLPEPYTNSLDAWRSTAEALNEIAENLAPHGMRVGYHNHAPEFQPLEGAVPWNVLFERVRPDVIAQMDLGHIVRAGADPLPYVERYAASATTVHVKEFPDAKMIGEGDVPFESIFQLLEAEGATEWYIVEIEEYPFGPLECARRALENLRAMGK